MSLVRLYARVMGLLGADRRLGGGPGLRQRGPGGGGLRRAAADGPHHRPADATSRRSTNAFTTLAPLIGAWVAFGLFTIAAGVTIALHADRLSHRNRLAAMANYFEHVLELPLAFHSSNHSGRVLKVMLEGSNGMSWLWLGFFRDHFVAFVSLDRAPADDPVRELAARLDPRRARRWPSRP